MSASRPYLTTASGRDIELTDDEARAVLARLALERLEQPATQAVDDDDGGSVVVDVFGVLPDGSRTEQLVYTLEGPRGTIFEDIGFEAEAACLGFASMSLENERPAARPAGSKLVAEWYDSDVPRDRLHSLQLWRDAYGEALLYRATRSTPYDVWSPPHCCGVGVTLGDAQQLAERYGLERYLPRTSPAPFAPGDRVTIIAYRHDFGTDDLPGWVTDTRERFLTVTLDDTDPRVRGLGILSIDVSPEQLERRDGPAAGSSRADS